MNAPVMAMTAVRLADLRDAPEVARIDAFLGEREASVFHRPLWLRAVEKGTGQRALGFVAERGGAMTGWLPLSDVHSPLFGRALISSGFGVGGGVIAERDAECIALCRAAEELALRRAASSVELRGGNAPAEWSSVTSKHDGFAAELEPDDEAQLTAIPRKARAEIRKGINGDLESSIGRDERHRAAHYRVYSESVRNLGTPVFPRSLFDAVLDLFGDDADILIVWHRQRPVAAVLSLYHRATVMPFWGGGRHEARALRANERMYYDLMCAARRRGCTHFDFGRSKVGSGPHAFKRNWGFEAEPLTYWTWSPPGQLKRNVDPTDAAYSSRIALWKRLPLPIANRIGPLLARGLG